MTIRTIFRRPIGGAIRKKDRNDAGDSLSMVQVMCYNIVDDVLHGGAGRYPGGDS